MAFLKHMAFAKQLNTLDTQLFQWVLEKQWDLQLEVQPAAPPHQTALEQAGRDASASVAACTPTCHAPAPLPSAR